MLPVGISFYTFQTLSYVIDVYRGDVKAERHFGYYATFISFFPQLVAGPIERTRNLLPQIKKEHVFDYDQATYGLKLMAWGYFKKLVIADNLAQYVSVVYDSPMEYRGFALVLASVFFTIQIYCDFSGYSDIAIGTAKLLGIDLMTNFKSPYFSQSVKEFWSRWHISLSTWFRDYVYIPLGGNRVGTIRHDLNLLITFMVSGMWHGANWTFVAWGGIHGVAQVMENALIPQKQKTSKGILWFVRVIFVFAFCTFAWIFFVSDSLGDAGYVILHLFDGILDPITYLYSGFADIGMVKMKFLTVTFGVLLLAIYDYISLKADCIDEISKMPLPVRYGAYMLLLFLIMCFRATQQEEFVYFQF
jgi:D-alanyl-lipoteichoic acid acyltransferase DltB (MBOAT superfamily)